jgi:hypothetical protein
METETAAEAAEAKGLPSLPHISKIEQMLF